MATPPRGSIPTMRRQGTVVRFDLDQGFGFIRPDEATRGDADLFVHISQVEGGRALHPGQRVAYQATRTEKGPAAIQVRTGSSLRAAPFRFLMLGLVGALVLVLAVTAIVDRTISFELLVSLWVVLISVVTFGAFGFDKSQATAGGLRVPEKVLHFLSLLGGSPGAFIGMRLFHHKTRKQSFQTIFWLIFAAQLAALAILFLRLESG